MSLAPLDSESISIAICSKGTTFDVLRVYFVN